MEKLGVAPRRRPIWPPEIKVKPQPLLSRYWDLLAVLLLVLGSFPTVWLAQQTVTLVPDLGLIDDNWHLDSTFKALNDIWIGRDVAFTHGPIFQALSAIPAHSIPVSLGALYATWNTIPIWCAFVFAYVALRLLLPEQPPWKRFLLLLLLASFWETSLRSTFPVLLFVVFLRGWYEVEAGRLRSTYAGAGGAVLCTIAFLTAGDVGIYATAAWFICWVAIAAEIRQRRFPEKLLSGLGAFLGVGILCTLAVNSFMARPFDFRFWRDSLAQVAAYRWATPAAMTDEGTAHLLGAIVICGAIFLARFRNRTRDTLPITQRTGFLLGGFVFGLAVLQSALVRSDIGHVMIGAFPLIFFAAVILFSFRGRPSRMGLFVVAALILVLAVIEGSFGLSPTSSFRLAECAIVFFACMVLFRFDRNAAMVGVIVAVSCSLLFSRPIFRPSNVLRLYGQLKYPLKQCLPGYSEFDRACYLEPLTPQMLRAGGTFLRRNTAVNQFTFVFPYQTMLGLAAQRQVAGGLMQAYTASGPYLSRLEISGLEGKPIPAALYFTDPDYRHMSQADVARWSRNYLSVPVDGIPNFTRTPEVWFWLVRHYRWAEQLTPGVVGLVRDESRHINFQTQPLALALQTFPISERNSATNLGAPNWPEGFDFIRLRMTVHYPALWRLRKPERLQLEITRADGSHDVQWMIVQPNVDSEVWFYPWDQPDLARYFNSDESQWRTWRSPVVGLRLLATPLDWVSERPEAITIESADAVRLEMH